MFKVVLIIIMINAVVACSPKNSATSGVDQANEVPYVIAKNYYVKNTFEADTLVNAAITTPDEFNKYFGMAGTMGKDGKPTPIDFSEEYVIAIITPKTSKAVTLIPKKLINDGNNLTFTYQYKSGKEQSFSIRPLLLIIVNKQYDGDVKVKRL